MTQVLDSSCAASFDHCNDLMSSYATQIKQDSNCGIDFKQSNPVVAQAYYGLVSYQTMYQAGCLKDDSGSYCMLTLRVTLYRSHRLTAYRFRRRRH